MLVSLVWIAVSLSFARTPIRLGQIPVSVVHQVQRKQLGSAAIFVEQALQEHPDDPGLLGLQGTIEGFSGSYSAGEAHLQQAEGSPYYEAYGIKYHADLLRTLGAGEAAAALRSGRLLFENTDEGREHTDMMDRVSDYRAIGAVGDAWLVIEQAMALGVRSAYYAAAAEIHMDLGELDEAGESLWLARWLDTGAYASIALAEARLLLLLADPDGAVRLLDAYPRRKVLNFDYWLLLAEACRQQGSLDRAAHILALQRFEKVVTPGKQALQARLLRDQGRPEEALAAIEFALADAPGNPQLELVYAELLGH